MQCSALHWTKLWTEHHNCTAQYRTLLHWTLHCILHFPASVLWTFPASALHGSMAPWPLFIHLYHSSLAWHSLVLPEYITTSGIYNRYQNISKLLEHITANWKYQRYQNKHSYKKISKLQEYITVACFASKFISSLESITSVIEYWVPRMYHSFNNIS